VIIYFHKCPTFAQGASGYHMTFTLGHPFVELEVPNDGRVTKIQVLSTSKMPLNMIDMVVKNNTSTASRN